MVNDAFNINDPFATTVQHQTPAHTPVAATLKKPPKWLRRPCGATFGVSKDASMIGMLVWIKV